jgi:hypothetical protein
MGPIVAATDWLECSSSGARCTLHHCWRWRRVRPDPMTQICLRKHCTNLWLSSSPRSPDANSSSFCLHYLSSLHLQPPPPLPERIRAVLSGNVEQATPRDLVSALDEIDFEFKHVQIYLQPCYSGSLACREIKLPYFLVEMDFYLFNTVKCFQ